MRICLIVEGCYPYVVGGVSAWVQMLMQRMPEHEFTIVSIGAEQKQKGVYKYELPPNLRELREYFLDEYLTRPATGKPVQLNPAQQNAVLDLLRGARPDWPVLFELFGGQNPCGANDFLTSPSFLQIVQRLAEAEGRNTPFKDLFWTLRSMLIPALNLLRCPVPEADVYHAVATGYAGLLGARFRWVTGKPFFVTEHGIYTREREEEILKAEWVPVYFKRTWIHFFRALSQAAYSQADQILSLFAGARDLQIGLGAEAYRCRVIPNGIDVDRFAAVPPIPTGKHPLHIGAVLRVVPIKDVKTLLYAFNLVKAKRRDARLTIIGPCDEDPDYYEECTALLERLGCPDVEFVGRADVTRWLPRLDMVVLTSISEGQPFVLLEAMAARRPVLATHVGACREIILGREDGFGPAGVVVPVMNPHRVAAGILEIGRSAAHMRALGQNGYRRVAHSYRVQDFLADYRALYGGAAPHTDKEVDQPWRASALH